MRRCTCASLPTAGWPSRGRQSASRPATASSFGHDGNSCLLGALDATVVEKRDGGEVLLAFDLSGALLDEALHAVGHIPLPPYIASKRPDDERDRTDYQTIFAREEGAVAAPTAGLHFTPEPFRALDARGIERHFVTLHVGAGTFLPVKADDTADHRMHAETGQCRTRRAGDERRHARAAAASSASARRRSGCSKARPETTARSSAWSGATSIFITPGYRFRTVDVLMTNFHLPRSTLFMLVSAFCGLETMRRPMRMRSGPATGSIPTAMPACSSGRRRVTMDDDLATMSRDELLAEVKRLRAGIRKHRDSTGHELCWHHPDLWGLLPEQTEPAIAVPPWPQFMRGCVRYRQSLDVQAPGARGP